jgi:hypothetical protein
VILKATNSAAITLLLLVLLAYQPVQVLL